MEKAMATSHSVAMLVNVEALCPEWPERQRASDMRLSSIQANYPASPEERFVPADTTVGRLNAAFMFSMWLLTCSLSSSARPTIKRQRLSFSPRYLLHTLAADGKGFISLPYLLDDRCYPLSRGGWEMLRYGIPPNSSMESSTMQENDMSIEIHNMAVGGSMLDGAITQCPPLPRCLYCGRYNNRYASHERGTPLRPLPFDLGQSARCLLQRDLRLHGHHIHTYPSPPIITSEMKLVPPTPLIIPQPASTQQGRERLNMDPRDTGCINGIAQQQ
ncbi:hypothetical protein V8F20_008340 [Naviculisporaceae sp. PSN 640]